MNVNIEELITLNYELEGLLYMVLHRGEDTPQMVWELIAEKIQGLSEGIAEHRSVKETEISLVKLTEASAITTTEKEAPAITTELPAIEEQNKEQETIQQQEVTIPIQEETKLVPEPESYPISIIEQQSDSLPQVEPTTSPDSKPKTRPKPVYEEQKAETVYTTAVEDKKPEVKNEEQGIRLDEKLARKTYKDLRKAFSLNDRFRFRRELFGNNENDFAEAINMIEAMSSIEEANDYFYNDLKWDKNNPEVQDFMAIVEHHFA